MKYSISFSWMSALFLQIMLWQSLFEKIAIKAYKNYGFRHDLMTGISVFGVPSEHQTHTM